MEEQIVNKPPKNLMDRDHLTILDGAIACFIYVILNIMFYFVLDILPAGLLKNQFWYAVASIVLELLFAAAALITVAFRQKNIVTSTTLNKKINWPIVGLCLIITLISLFGFNYLTNAFITTLEIFGYKSVLSGSSITSVGSYFVSILTVCVLPAFCEELLFRGIVLNSFRGLNKWLGITASAFFFMIMHGNPDQTVHQFMLGFALGYIAWETRNIWITILIHFLNNFIEITMSLILYLSNPTSSGEPQTVTITLTNLLVMFVLGFVFAALAVWLIIFITKYIKKQSDKINNKVTAEATVDGSEIVAEVNNGEDANNNEQEVQQTNSSGRVVTLLGYLVFVGYFLYEWIRLLIVGLR